MGKERVGIKVSSRSGVLGPISLEVAQWDDRLLGPLTAQYLRSLPATYRYGLVLVLVAVATGLRWALIPWLGTVAPYNVALVAGIAATVLLGLGPGLLTVVLGCTAVEAFVLGVPLSDGSVLLRLGVSMSIGMLVVLILHAIRVAALKARRSAERLAAFAAATFEGVGESEDGRIVDCNEQLAQMLGYTVAELRGKAIAEFIVPEERERVLANIQTNQASSIEHRMLRKDGTCIVVEARGRPMAPGSARRHTAIRDITERKRAEEALRTALVESHRFREALENVPAYVYMKDLQFRYLYANKLTLELFGCSAEELVGCDDSRFFPSDSAQRLREVDQRVVAGRQSTEEIIGAEIGGRRRVYLEYKTPIYADPEGKVICGLLGISTDITERKQMEELLEQRVRQRTVDLAKALAEAERGRATLDALLESIPEGITIADAAGLKLVRASRYMAEMLGVDVKTLEGVTIYEYVQRWATFEADGVTPLRAEDFPVMQAMREGTTVQGRELVTRRADGAKVPILSSAAPIRDSSGRIAGGVGAWRDITERKRAEGMLRASEQRLRLFVEHAPAALAMFDRQMRYLMVSRRWLSDYGLEGQDLLGRSHYEVFPEIPERWRDIHRRALGGEVVRAEEDPFQRADGSMQWLRWEVRPWHDGAGQIAGIVVFSEDITQQQAAKEALRDSEADLVQAQRVAHIGNWSWDARTDTGTASDELLRIYGFDPATQAIPNFADQRGLWYPPEEWDRLNAAVQEAARTGVGYDLEVQALRNGQHIWVQTRSEAVRDAEGRIVGLRGTVQDITERKRAEAALRELNETLEHRVVERTEALRIAKAEAEQANAAKDHFLAVLSHELRTPLTPVLPVLEELAKQVPEEAREDVEMVHRNVELEARLIDDLLDVTRIARGKVELRREMVELCTVMRRAAEVCAPDVEARRLHFGIKVEGGPYAVEGDPARLQQVFWNLIKNAIKFTPHGGCVGIHCRSDGDGQVVAEVKDSGIGIEPEGLERIFNAFEQVDRTVTRRFGGLGLGLAICKALVELHGGTITAHSHGKGKGATFTVTLPIHKMAGGKAMPREACQAARAAQAPAVTRPLEILLVEDHGDTARIMRRMLQAKGHQVETAGDVATALELARDRAFDLLLSDLGLPDGSGVELMQQLREQGQRLPGIALSGFGQEEDIRRSKEAGFAAHLTKPINPDQLTRAIGTVVHAGAAG